MNRMKRFGTVGLLGMGLIFSVLTSVRLEAEEGEAMSGDAIMDIVRGSYVGEDFEVDGQLRVASSRLFGSGSRQPFKMTGQPGYIQFVFSQSGDVLQVDMTGARPVVREAKGGALAVVPAERYGEQVMGVPVLFEDLAMRYFYWPATGVLGEETVQGDKCWIVEVKNPGVGGPYGKARLWIGQKSGAVLKMEGYDANGKRVKEFKVISVHTVDGMWMFKSVGIESFDPVTGKKAGEKVYLETSNPRKAGSPMRKR
ncbi:MAG: outer membrane lipoprotein-sorting protein [Verrucomicrobiota bacterium]